MQVQCIEKLLRTKYIFLYEYIFFDTSEHFYLMDELNFGMYLRFYAVLMITIWGRVYDISDGAFNGTS